MRSRKDDNDREILDSAGFYPYRIYSSRLSDSSNYPPDIYAILVFAGLGDRKETVQKVLVVGVLVDILLVVVTTGKTDAPESI